MILSISWLACAPSVPMDPQPNAPLAPPPEPTATPLEGPLFTHGLGCEVSAALQLSGGRILLGDNEVDDQLIVLPLRDGRPDLGSPTIVQLEDDKINGKQPVGDIEALAWGATSDVIYVVGSNGRKGSCEDAGKRMRIAKLSVPGGGGFTHHSTRDLIPGKKDAPRAHLATVEGCRSLFGKDSGSLVEPLCEQIAASDLPRTVGGENECDHALQLEGAVRIGGRLWVGLRGPLSTDRDAWLVRVDLGTPERPFDAVARLKSGKGFGVRDLTERSGALYAVVGPVPDGTEKFFVQRYPAPGPDLVLEPQTSWEVATGSESIVLLDDDTALLLQDGKEPPKTEDQGKAASEPPAWGRGGGCVQESKWTVVTLDRGVPGGAP